MRAKLTVKLAAWLWLLACGLPSGNLRAAVTGQTLDRLDRAPGLDAQFGVDRVAKYLVVRANSGDAAQTVRRTFLERTLMEMLPTPGAMRLLGADLARGDSRLADALRALLLSYNFSTAQADGLLTRWAAGNPPAEITGILRGGGGDGCRALADYLLTVDAIWCAVVYNAAECASGGRPVTPGMLADTIFRSGGETTREEALAVVKLAGTGDVSSRLRLTRSLRPALARRGTVARYLETVSAPPETFYAHAWAEVAERIAADPLLLRDYATRLTTATPVLDITRDALAGAFALSSAQLVAGLERARLIHGSRCEWFWNNATRGNEQAGTEAVRREMERRLAVSPEYGAYLLWHFTRPAEGLSLAIRTALPAALSADPEVARSVALALLQPDNAGRARLADETGAFGYYGKPAEFRSKLVSGEVSREALQDFGAKFGVLLSASDQAWDGLFAEIGGATVAVKRALVVSAVQSNATACLSLLQSILRTDLTLRDGFAGWLVEKKKFDTPGDAVAWLGVVDEDMRAGRLVGNQKVGSFKALVAAYLQTTGGWEALQNHLKAEGVWWNSALRAALVRYFEANPGVFWQWLDRVYAGPYGKLPHQALRGYVAHSRLGEELLREIEANNSVAVDAMFPVWGRLLASNSECINSIASAAVSGRFVGDLYSTFALALNAAVSRPEVRALVEPRARALVQAPPGEAWEQVLEKTRNFVYNNREQSNDFLRYCMGVPELREAWRREFLTQVRIYARGAAVASHIVRNDALQRQWLEMVADAVVAEPALLRNILSALGGRKGANTMWKEEARRKVVALYQLMAGERVLFEQILAAPGVAEAFKDAAEDTIGLPAAADWLGVK